MTTLDQALDGARRLAKSAALRNLGTAACPYPADGTNGQKAARYAWYAEYLRRRPPIGKVDYSSDLDYLAGTADETAPDAAGAGDQAAGELFPAGDIGGRG